MLRRSCATLVGPSMRLASRRCVSTTPLVVQRYQQDPLDLDFSPRRRYEYSTTTGRQENRAPTRRNLTTRSQYDALCAKLENGLVTDGFNELANLGFVSLSFDEERNFIDKYLKNWFASMNASANADRTYLARVVFELSALNKKTEGEVLKHITWEEIESAAISALNDVNLYVLAINVQTVLKGLARFVNLFGQVPSKNLLDCIHKSLSEYFSPSGSFNKKPLNRLHVGHILFNASEVGLPRLSDEAMRVAVSAAWINLNARHAELCTLNSKINLQDATDAFFKWNYNANEYKKGFWYFYFVCVEKYFKNQMTYKGVSVAKSLKSCLKVAIKFGVENDFGRIKPFFVDQMGMHVDQLTKKEVDSILNVAKEKYAEKMEEQMKNLITPSIFDRLNKVSKS